MDFEMDSEVGRMYITEPNNNIAEKQRYHDPWTRNPSSNGLKDAEAPLVEKYAGGKIYKGPKRNGSQSSAAPLTGVAKRKQSVYHEEPTAGSASFAISVFNLMNAILGSGILGLPYAMAQLGMVLFFVSEVIVAILALYSISLLLKLCDQTNVKAYEKLGFIAFGLPGRIVAAICILMQNIGAMCSYLFIVKYELPNVIMTLTGVHESDGSWYYNGDILVLVVTGCIILPLASLKNIGFLGYTSGFSITCMFFFTGVVIAKKFIIECPLFDQSLFENATHTGTSNLTHGDDVTGLENTISGTHLPDVVEAVTDKVKIIFETAASFATVNPLRDDVTGLENTISGTHSPDVMEEDNNGKINLMNGTQSTDLAGAVTDTVKKIIETSFATVTPRLSNETSHDGEYVLTPMEEKAFHLYEEFGPQQCEAQAFALTDKWAYSIPTMTFSFVCHTAVLPIYAELKKPCAARMQKVSNASISICFILYSLSALFGYLTFYNWMEAELLLMYSYADAADTLTLIVRLCVLAAVVLTVPLTHFPARKAITFLLFPNKDFSWIRHIGIMIGLLTFINLLVIFVPTIREVFGIIGATASTMLVFILPCIFFVRIDESPIKSPKKIGAIILCVLGICLMIQSLTVIILGYVS